MQKETDKTAKAALVKRFKQMDKNRGAAAKTDRKTTDKLKGTDKEKIGNGKNKQVSSADPERKAPNESKAVKEATKKDGTTDKRATKSKNGKVAKATEKEKLTQKQQISAKKVEDPAKSDVTATVKVVPKGNQNKKRGADEVKVIRSKKLKRDESDPARGFDVENDAKDVDMDGESDSSASSSRTEDKEDTEMKDVNDSGSDGGSSSASSASDEESDDEPMKGTADTRIADSNKSGSMLVASDDDDEDIETKAPVGDKVNSASNSGHNAKTVAELEGSTSESSDNSEAEDEDSKVSAVKKRIASGNAIDASEESSEESSSDDSSESQSGAEDDEAVKKPVNSPEKSDSSEEEEEESGSATVKKGENANTIVTSDLENDSEPSDTDSAKSDSDADEAVSESSEGEDNAEGGVDRKDESISRAAKSDRREQTSTPTKDYKIWVSNISFNSTPDAVRAFFEECGEITDFYMPMSENNRHRGTAKIEFSTAEAATAAVDLNETELDGRSLTIRLYERRQSFEQRGGDQRQNFGQRGGDRRQSFGQNGGDRRQRFAASLLAGSANTTGQYGGDRRQSFGERNESTLFVGNLPFRADEDEIRGFFGGAGEIRSVRMPVFADTGKRKGVAFVEFTNGSSVKSVLNDQSKWWMGGRQLKLDVAGGGQQQNRQQSSAYPRPRLQYNRGGPSNQGGNQRRGGSFPPMGGSVDDARRRQSMVEPQGKRIVFKDDDDE